MTSDKNLTDEHHLKIAFLSSINNTLTDILKTLLAIFVAALITDVSWGVASRFLLNAQSLWTEELARFLLIWITMLGASLAFRQKQHLGVDILTSQFDKYTQLFTACIADFIILFFLIYIFFGVAERFYSTASICSKL